MDLSPFPIIRNLATDPVIRRTFASKYLSSDTPSVDAVVTLTFARTCPAVSGDKTASSRIPASTVSTFFQPAGAEKLKLRAAPDRQAQNNNPIKTIRRIIRRKISHSLIRTNSKLVCYLT